jgi:hypothetical protein
VATTHPARYEPMCYIANIRDDIERFFREGCGPAARELVTEAVSGLPR